MSPFVQAGGERTCACLASHARSPVRMGADHAVGRRQRRLAFAAGVLGRGMHTVICRRRNS